MVRILFFHYSCVTNTCDTSSHKDNFISIKLELSDPPSTATHLKTDVAPTFSSNFTLGTLDYSDIVDSTLSFYSSSITSTNTPIKTVLSVPKWMSL